MSPRVTHLVMRTIKVTNKSVLALCYQAHLVTPDFVAAAASQPRPTMLMPDPAQYVRLSARCWRARSLLLTKSPPLL